MNKFKELNIEEREIIIKYCKDNENGFRNFIRKYIETNNNYIQSCSSNEMAYEFGKHKIRESEIDSLLNNK